MKTFDVYHSIRRESVSREEAEEIVKDKSIPYADYHSLICQIKDENDKLIGIRSIGLPKCTLEGYFTKEYKPTVDKNKVTRLAYSVSKKYPFEEGDQIIARDYQGLFNVVQFPLEDRLLDVFREKLLGRK
ncbi:MAG: hypothetical protein WCV90_08755 [Candidatus Woesearchaeota archaeon]